MWQSHQDKVITLEKKRLGVWQYRQAAELTNSAKGLWTLIIVINVLLVHAILTCALSHVAESTSVTNMEEILF